MKTFVEVLEFSQKKTAALVIGYKAASYAVELLEITDENKDDIVCITETDTAAVDGLQVVLGTTVGNGKLFFHITGKFAFNVYNKATNKSVRIMLKPVPDLDCTDMLEYVDNKDKRYLFDIKETTLEAPDKVCTCKLVTCDICGEQAKASNMHLNGDKTVCNDCNIAFNKFSV